MTFCDAASLPTRLETRLQLSGAVEIQASDTVLFFEVVETQCNTITSWHTFSRLNINWKGIVVLAKWIRLCESVPAFDRLFTRGHMLLRSNRQEEFLRCEWEWECYLSSECLTLMNMETGAHPSQWSTEYSDEEDVVAKSPK